MAQVVATYLDGVCPGPPSDAGLQGQVGRASSNLRGNPLVGRSWPRRCPPTAITMYKGCSSRGPPRSWIGDTLGAVSSLRRRIVHASKLHHQSLLCAVLRQSRKVCLYYVRRVGNKEGGWVRVRVMGRSRVRGPQLVLASQSR